VTAAPDEAFRVFTQELETWWPLERHSRAEGGRKTEKVVVEPHADGRIFEVFDDGSEGYWGTVRVYEPASRFVIGWRPSPDESAPHTEIEVSFSPADGGGTDVTLEHRGWELLAPDVAGPVHESYHGEWGFVFDGCYGAVAGRTD
jgi:hypothetical protein